MIFDTSREISERVRSNVTNVRNTANDGICLTEVSSHASTPRCGPVSANLSKTKFERRDCRTLAGSYARFSSNSINNENSFENRSRPYSSSPASRRPGVNVEREGGSETELGDSLIRSDAAHRLRPHYRNFRVFLYIFEGSIRFRSRRFRIRAFCFRCSSFWFVVPSCVRAKRSILFPRRQQAFRVNPRRLGRAGINRLIISFFRFDRL